VIPSGASGYTVVVTYVQVIGILAARVTFRITARVSVHRVGAVRLCVLAIEERRMTHRTKHGTSRDGSESRNEETHLEVWFQ